MSATQKQKIAIEVESGASASELAERYDVSTTIYNVRNSFRAKGALAFMDVKESIEVSRIDPCDLPDDIETLKKRRAELELDNVILEQTIEILKRPKRRPIGSDECRENDGNRRA